MYIEIYVGNDLVATRQMLKHLGASEPEEADLNNKSLFLYV